MEEDSDSVFTLITNLCETFFTNGKNIRKQRSNCYELLLGKKIITNPRKFKDLEGTGDPMLSLLAWCYTLTHKYDLRETAEDLKHCSEKLKNLYGSDTGSFNSVLTFMLCLKDIPKKNNNKLDLSTLPNIDDNMLNYKNMFKLPESFYETDSLNIFEFNKKLKKPELVNSQFSIGNFAGKEYKDLQNENKFFPEEESIWDIVMKTKFSKRKNWESYGCGPPDKEKPFLSELGELSSLWVENLESLYLAYNVFPSFTIVNNKMKSRVHFIRDLKYLLVGMPSESFNLTNRGEFFISPGIMVDGITPDALERYCNDFLFSGTCYRALSKMATRDPNTRKYEYDGYVFTEFCESMSHYVQFYRLAVFSLPDSTNFLTFYKKINQLQMQISTIASICKVGPYKEKSVKIPHGVALLNYLYQKLLDVIDKNLAMVLYSILFPCCQVYFSRFLYRWVLKGSVSDPYGEFFITPNIKYISTRGRTYWTRGYEIKEDIVPDFLLDLKDDILICGKIMNLLQLCFPMNKLCMYLMGKKPSIFLCCLTYSQLNDLEQNCAKYFLEAHLECGSKFSFSDILEKSLEKDMTFVKLIAKKRMITLQRLELERQKAKQEQHEKRMEEYLSLEGQYEAALRLKQLKIYKEIEEEIKYSQKQIRIEEMRERLIEEEATKMIDYYAQLCQTADNQKDKIEKYIRNVKNIHLDTQNQDQAKLSENVQEKCNSSTESFYSVTDDAVEKVIEQCHVIEEEIEPDDISEKMDKDVYDCNVVQEIIPMHTSESLDMLNANFKEKKNIVVKENEKDSVETITESLIPMNTNIQQTMRNFEIARRNKQKVLNQELGIPLGFWGSSNVTEMKQPSMVTHLSEAQCNKLKILSSEFGIDVIKENVTTERVLTIAQVNRNKILGHTYSFAENNGKTKLDNENFVNKNFNNYLENNDITSNTSITKSKSLVLDLDKVTPKFEPEKPMPMSVDSTPLSDLPQMATPLSDLPRSNTPSSMFLSVDTKFDSDLNTADTNQTEDVFNFNGAFKPFYHNEKPEESTESTFSKTVTVEVANSISKNSLKLILHESVSISLLTQLKLANNEILKYFVEDLNYLNHLESLRDYFFLQDGEFGRNITENLFEKLYSANFPLELINCRTLQHLVFNALDRSSKFQKNAKYLSFKVNSLPKCFDLGNPDVLDCLSLTYKVKWPLNILLPSDTVAKYDQVFKYLIKLNRVSWVLKKIFLELKILAKETGKKEIYLMSSEQYNKLHQYRHIMTHFMQTLQNYIVGEVLQPSWELYERSLNNVTNLDELYNAHTAYIKNILFRCMLNQKCATLRNIIQKVFVVILKFYDYLRSRQWICEDGSYVHPNFSKLEKIFKNFEEFVVYLFQVAKKVAKSGYQPHLKQFLDVLDVNDFYSKKLLTSTS